MGKFVIGFDEYGFYFVRVNGSRVGNQKTYSYREAVGIVESLENDSEFEF